MSDSVHLTLPSIVGKLAALSHLPLRDYAKRGVIKVDLVLHAIEGSCGLIAKKKWYPSDRCNHSTTVCRGESIERGAGWLLQGSRTLHATLTALDTYGVGRKTHTFLAE